MAASHPLRKFGSEFSVQGEDPIRHHVRRKVRYGVMVNPASHTKFLTDPRVKGIRRSYDHVLMFAQTTSASVLSATSSLASSGNVIFGYLNWTPLVGPVAGVRNSRCV